MVNDNLTWDSNTSYLLKRANARMRLLHKLVDFGVPHEDLVCIYILYVRSILEQSCQVWHSSLTLENFQDLERVQKNALRIILQENYLSYSNALDITGIPTLFEKWAHPTWKQDSGKEYKVTASRVERLKNSAVPLMQRLLNLDAAKKK